MSPKKDKGQRREGHAGNSERQALSERFVDRGRSGAVKSIGRSRRELPTARRICPIDFDHDLARANPIAPRESRRGNVGNRTT
jgi:hypothetical protein